MAMVVVGLSTDLSFLAPETALAAGLAISGRVRLTRPDVLVRAPSSARAAANGSEWLRSYGATFCSYRYRNAAMASRDTGLRPPNEPSAYPVVIPVLASHSISVKNG